MQRADVVVVGGGPAGASCAERLVRAGMRVVVVQRPRFDRDKPRAGWIAPEAVRAAGLDLAEYGRARSLQPVRRFRVGWIGGGGREVDYREPVSFGVLRRELDGHLLERSGAVVWPGPVASLRRGRGRWIVGEAASAPFVVGAGGHFCPVARALMGRAPAHGVAVARELAIELPLPLSSSCRVDAARPELDFGDGFDGYGWVLRRGDSLSVGFGRRSSPSLADELQAYLDWLVRAGRLPMGLPPARRTHEYRLREGTPPRVAAEGILLAGDAAGLGNAAGGEGILPAIQSGHAAAEVILEAASGHADAFDSYPARLARALGPRSEWTAPGPLRALAGRALPGSAWFGRPLAPDRAPAHRPAPALVTGSA